MKRIIAVTTMLLAAVAANLAQQVTQGSLEVVDKGGNAASLVPLKHTAVEAEITGFLSRVTVRQQFENNFKEKIEAVYVFPLPQNAAVDGLLMKIGERTVRGKIMKREEAREVYEAARSNGQIASLLDQERPNIFTQSVANILPGEKITIEITYVETLKYEDGAYEFVFPMVVGPRYIPGNPTGTGGRGYGPDTDQVPDGSRITPPVAKERAGHDISLKLTLDAGVPVTKVRSRHHEVDSQMLSAGSYSVVLANSRTIPNRDFVLRYEVAGSQIEDAVLTHRGDNGGYFTLILQPPAKVRTEDVTPKEIVFVLDTSGSMSGFPIEKAKEAMKMALEGLNPYDTFNLITFAGDTHVLFSEPVQATVENLAKAQAFLASRNGGGGTEMMKAIRTALEPSDSQEHIRVVCFMTDGYIGNDMAILGEIRKHPNARIFSFGIGNSVNRYLLERMADEGRGEAEFVSLKDDGSAAAKRFHERVRSPLLTDISLEYSGIEVADVYPKRINDLFSAKPLVIHGRYTKGGKGTVRLTGKSFGREVVREIPVTFPDREPAHDSLATLWARTRIADLMSQDYSGIQYGNAKPEIEQTITNLGIEYGLMTQFTSFVAVEERVVTDGGRPITIEVPVEMPEGVSREGVFGDRGRTVYGGAGSGRAMAKSIAMPSPKAPVRISAESKVDRDYADDKEEVRAANSLAGQIIAMVLPVPGYPSGVSRGDSLIEVDLVIDRTGKVTSAKAKGRRTVFSSAAEKAALGSAFSVPATSIRILEVNGVIRYRFTKDGKTSIVSGLNSVRVETAPNKYHASVRKLVDRVLSGGPAGPSEAGWVTAGRATVVVRVASIDAATTAALRKAGLAVMAELGSAKAVVGSIDARKIEGLAELDQVTFISPQRR